MELYYTEKGSGNPMVLLHGNGEDGTCFKEQIQYFSMKYHVFAVDTRGHGKSPRGTKPFTLKQFAKDLKTFVDKRKIKKMILLGFSDGGNIALIFTLKYPEYVERLILNGANLNPFGMKHRVYAQILSEYALALQKGVADKKLEHEAEKQIKEKLKRKRERLGLMLREPRISPQSLRKIQIPVLVIAGTNDMIKKSHTKLIHRMLPESYISFIEGNHFIAYEKSKEFNQAVENFLKDTEFRIKSNMEGSEAFERFIGRLKRQEKNRIPGLLDKECQKDTAVMVLLAEKKEEPYVIFEIRSDQLRTQPGEVCFPGGSIERGETPEMAAVREATEELCVREEQIEVIAPLDLLITPAGVTVHPFLAVVRQYKGTYSEDEVGRIFEIPLSWFLSHEPRSSDTKVLTVPGEDFPFDLIPDGQKYRWREGRYRVLFYETEEAVIWGMTAKILHSFIQLYREKNGYDSSAGSKEKAEEVCSDR